MVKRKFCCILATLIVLLAFLLFSFFSLFDIGDRGIHPDSNMAWETTLSENNVYDDGRIILFGDSQISLWPMMASFGILPIANRGIGGDLARQAIERFDDSVKGIQTKQVVILIGTNDLACGDTPVEVAAHVEMIVEKSIDCNIPVVLCSLLPVRGRYIDVHPPPMISAVNEMMKEMAERHNIIYVDFHSAMTDKEGLFDPIYTSDGLHPNFSGYIRMARMLSPSLATP